MVKKPALTPKIREAKGMEFVEVAKLGQVPEGRGMLVEPKGKKIALFKVQSKVYAISHECAHKGGPLADGDVRDCTVACPWHHWVYDLKSGESASNPPARVHSYKVKTDGGKVFVEV
jgi:nitrite reductase/ring-hydroxylating ferredoxin subunit